jgi:hypothetical protein
MPRISNAGINVKEWSERTGNGATTFDLCAECAEPLKSNPHEFDDDDNFGPEHAGEPRGDEGFEVGVEHPPYEHGTGDGPYLCEVCGDELTDEDA